MNSDFANKYSQSKGIISKSRKKPQLALVTVTSALGKSSLYNRLRLSSPNVHGDSTKARAPIIDLIKLGATRGYGHFHLSNSVFERIRLMLADEGHPYASGHKFGEGPYWRFRVIRVGLNRLGLDDELLRHGITREVFAMKLTPKFRELLKGEAANVKIHRPTLSEIAGLAKERWLIPRAHRMPDFRSFRREKIMELIDSPLQ